MRTKSYCADILSAAGETCGHKVVYGERVRLPRSVDIVDRSYTTSTSINDTVTLCKVDDLIEGGLYAAQCCSFPASNVAANYAA